jgi:hypothetical protein
MRDDDDGRHDKGRKNLVAIVDAMIVLQKCRV